jgi:tight adherence protein C
MSHTIWMIGGFAGLTAFCLVFGLGMFFNSNSSDAQRLNRPKFWRLLSPVVSPIEALLGRYLPQPLRISATRALHKADLNRELTPQAVWAASVICCLLGLLIAALLSFVLKLALIKSLLICSLIGVLPFVWLRDKAQIRELQISKQLPFVLDLITLAVESGLNLNSALQETVHKGPAGPLRNEFALVLRDIRAGKARAQALQAMADRIRLPSVSNLIASLIATERQGGAIGALLRGQAQQRRTERFLRAEKLAMQAPVKMLLPLITCIFPCTFIILFFPVLHKLTAQGWVQ